MTTPAAPTRGSWLVRRLWLPYVLMLTGLGILATLHYRERILFEGHSAFSHLRVRANGSLRSLVFVRDNGDEALQSRIDLSHPEVLHMPYTRAMFASFLVRPRQEDILIVGLGGGTMVRFLQTYSPETRVDVVEIDPVVIDVADRFFGVRTEGKTRVLQEDGFRYLRETSRRYDVIYMDAFLKPSEDTDATGVPRRLKTLAFFRQIRDKLHPGGLVVFNINDHPEIDDDLATIDAAFAQVWVVSPEDTTNQIALALTEATAMQPLEWKRRAAEAQQRFDGQIDFLAYVQSLAGTPTASPVP